MTDALVTYELGANGVAEIGLNRPEKRNAISDRFIEQIAIAVEQAQAEAKAAIIFGHGPHFCAGLDLAEHVQKTAFEGIKGSRRWHVVFDRIQRGEIPFVAALHGAVIGGGLELAASTHIRVAEASAFFALPEGQRGIYVGGGGSVRIARLMSVARMMDLMLTGRSLSADEAERASLVQYLTGSSSALDKAREIAAAMTANAPFSNYAVINALPRIQDMAQDDGLFVESLVASLASASPEAEARLKAFLEKRAGKVTAPQSAPQSTPKSGS